MDETNEPEPRKPRLPQVYCSDCQGTGQRVEPRLYLKDGQAGSIFGPVTCRTCRGKPFSSL